MGNIETGTVCRFPYIWPEAINFSTNPADCTQTFGQRLGTGHDVFQAVLLIIGVTSLVIFIRRLYLLKQYTKRKGVSFVGFPTFPYFICVCLFAFFFSLESFDVFAFRGWYPAPLYYLLDELVAASLISVAIVLVDFWVRCARGMGNQRIGMQPYEKNFLIVITYCNFLGFIVAGIVDSPRFKLYEALKSFVGATIVIFFLVRSAIAVNALRRTLKHTLTDSSKEHSTAEENDRDKNTRKAAKTLIRKYAQFCVILVIAALALVVNAFLSLQLDNGLNWQWTVRFADQYDAVQIVLRVIYMLCCLAGMSFFRVPRDHDQPVSTAEGSAQKRTGTSPSSFFGSIHKIITSIKSPGQSKLTAFVKRSKDGESGVEVHPQSIVVVSGETLYETTIRPEHAFSDGANGYNKSTVIEAVRSTE